MMEGEFEKARRREKRVGRKVKGEGRNERKEEMRWKKKQI